MKFLKICAVLACGLAYFATPFDIVPDFLLGPGQVDDLIVLAWAIAEAYRIACDDPESIELVK